MRRRILKTAGQSGPTRFPTEHSPAGRWDRPRRASTVWATSTSQELGRPDFVQLVQTRDLRGDSGGGLMRTPTRSHDAARCLFSTFLQHEKGANSDLSQHNLDRHRAVTLVSRPPCVLDVTRVWRRARGARPPDSAKCPAISRRGGKCKVESRRQIQELPKATTELALVSIDKRFFLDLVIHFTSSYPTSLP